MAHERDHRAPRRRGGQSLSGVAVMTVVPRAAHRFSSRRGYRAPLAPYSAAPASLSRREFPWRARSECARCPFPDRSSRSPSNGPLPARAWLGERARAESQSNAPGVGSGTIDERAWRLGAARRVVAQPRHQAIAGHEHAEYQHGQTGAEKRNVAAGSDRSAHGPIAALTRFGGLRFSHFSANPCSSTIAIKRGSRNGNNGRPCNCPRNMPNQSPPMPMGATHWSNAALILRDEMSAR